MGCAIDYEHHDQEAQLHWQGMVWLGNEPDMPFYTWLADDKELCSRTRCMVEALVLHPSDCHRSYCCGFIRG